MVKVWLYVSIQTHVHLRSGVTSTRVEREKGVEREEGVEREVVGGERDVATHLRGGVPHSTTVEGEGVTESHHGGEGRCGEERLPYYWGGRWR